MFKVQQQQKKIVSEKRTQEQIKNLHCPWQLNEKKNVVQFCISFRHKMCVSYCIFTVY